MRWGQGVFKFIGMYSDSAYTLDTYLSSRVQTGISLRNGQTFEEFMGPFLNTLNDKYFEWLSTSYSM